MQPASDTHLRYAVDEKPPLPLASMLGAQLVLLILAGIVLTPAIVLRAAEMPVELEAGVIFFALLVCGTTTILQARRVWRIGAGYTLLMGTSGAFIAVAVSALQAGGMSLLMTLIVAASLVQFLMAAKLGWLRRIITPLAGGTTIMLLAVTVMPIAFAQFGTAGSEGGDGPAAIVAGVTLLTILLLSFFGSNSMRLWAPLIGILAGTAVNAVLMGLDTSRIDQAAWFGLPSLTWPGFDLSFGLSFWTLLPAFIIVTLVGAIETFGDAVAVQELSHREKKPMDHRTVQGALYADGLGNFLSGILGTMPNTTYSTSISVVDMTGVAARRVGVLAGVFLLVLAFFPKLAAAVLSIPPAVVGAYIMVLILLLFMHGVRMVVADGLSYEKGFIVGMGFWLGMGFQNQRIFPELIPEWLSPILDNGMTAGTLVTLLLIMLLGLRQGRKKTVNAPLSVDSLPTIRAALETFCERRGWRGPAIGKARLAVEETLLALLEMRGNDDSKTITTRWEFRALDEAVEIDVAVAPIGSNLEGLVAKARDSQPEATDQLSLKILDVIASHLKHFQFDQMDFISMQVPTAEPVEPTRRLV